MFHLQDYSFENLKNKNCHPFDKKTKSLTIEQANDVLKFIFINHIDSTQRTQRWQVIQTKNALILNGKFIFSDYDKTFAFVSAIYLLAKQQNYYPDITFGDGFVYISLFSIKIKGIHENEFIMLVKIENLIQDNKLN